MFEHKFCILFVFNVFLENLQPKIILVGVAEFLTLLVLTRRRPKI
jgi:hypothetical protein